MEQQYRKPLLYVEFTCFTNPKISMKFRPHRTPKKKIHAIKDTKYDNTGWRTKCHTTDCARNTFLLLQKHLTSGTELILTGWKIVPNEEHVQCDHRFASQPLANEPLHSSQLFDTSLQKARGTTSLCGP